MPPRRCGTSSWVGEGGQGRRKRAGKEGGAASCGAQLRGSWPLSYATALIQHSFNTLAAKLRDGWQSYVAACLRSMVECSLLRLMSCATAIWGPSSWRLRCTTAMSSAVSTTPHSMALPAAMRATLDSGERSPYLNRSGENASLLLVGDAEMIRWMYREISGASGHRIRHHPRR